MSALSERGPRKDQHVMNCSCAKLQLWLHCENHENTFFFPGQKCLESHVYVCVHVAIARCEYGFVRRYMEKRRFVTQAQKMRIFGVKLPAAIRDKACCAGIRSTGDSRTMSAAWWSSWSLSEGSHRSRRHSFCRKTTLFVEGPLRNSTHAQRLCHTMNLCTGDCLLCLPQNDGPSAEINTKQFGDLVFLVKTELGNMRWNLDANKLDMDFWIHPQHAGTIVMCWSRRIIAPMWL